MGCGDRRRRKLPAQDGFKLLAALEAEFGPLPVECPRAGTPSDGQHMSMAGQDVCSGRGSGPVSTGEVRGNSWSTAERLTTDGKASYRWAVPRNVVLADRDRYWSCCARKAARRRATAR